MKSVVRPELSTAAAGPSQAPTAAVDNSAPRSTHPEPTYKSGKTVQLTGTTYSLVYSTYLEVANYPVQATSRMELPWTAWVGPSWWAALFLPIFQ